MEAGWGGWCSRVLHSCKGGRLCVPPSSIRGIIVMDSPARRVAVISASIFCSVVKLTGWRSEHALTGGGRLPSRNAFASGEKLKRGMRCCRYAMVG